MELTDIYRTFHPKTTEYTFFSSAHGTFSRTDNMLGHKTSLSKFKKIEIISSIFSNHDNMRLEMNWKKRLQNQKQVEAKEHATKQPMEIKEENQKIPGEK